MVQIKGHKKVAKQRRYQKWPRRWILKHTIGKCPYCKRHVKNIEAHINEMHKFEKTRKIKGKIRGHE